MPASNALRHSTLAGSLAFLLLGGVAEAQDADAMLTAYMDAFNSHMPPNFDAQALSELYAEDAVLMTPFDASALTHS
ncbi:MAG: hypothetical protein ACR2RE_18975 [Geminicoccaceae bacterium]